MSTTICLLNEWSGLGNSFLCELGFNKRSVLSMFVNQLYINIFVLSTVKTQTLTIIN